ncbi:chromate reductase [Chitinivorax tropicus]|uniref:Chromate reductase n=1 Tax=Chitinivorax tropicus TaxID=714531 RepID=A0A840MV27_9PROT|nr:NADPH-dependent FMN reductase [Chitinivorax tropicus]MBB5020206.1 chromate reductase [Chitinivorax tropicus]
MSLHFLGITGSLRQQSRNKGLLRAAATNVPAGVTMDIADLSDIPFYNADITNKPASVQRVLDQIAKADALVIACPEYNYSIAPALKNILDWASREPGNALLAGKAVALMGAAGGMGSARAQYHLRQVCVFLDLHPLNKPEVFANAFSDGFDDAGNLVDERILQLIREQLQALVTWSTTLERP